MSNEISPHPESSVSPLTSEVRAALGRVEFPVGACHRRGLERLFETLAVPESGALRVAEMLSGEPVRRVGGGRANVVVRYASRKMRRILQAESRNVEFVFVLRCEHDERILAYLCQPARLHVKTLDRKGRRRRRPYVPDYLVVTSDSIELVGCKTVSELEADQAHPHPRYVRGEDGIWRFPAADEAARDLGLVHRVHTSSEVNPSWVRNIEFLSGYVGADAPDVADLDLVLDLVRRDGSVRAAAVLEEPGVKAEALWWLVANRHLWVDWEGSLVFDIDTCWVHADEAALLSHSRLRLVEPSPSDPILSLQLDADATVLWDDVRWTVLNAGSQKVTLQKEGASGRVVELAVDSVRDLLRAGSLRADAVAEADARIRTERERIARLATSKEKRRAIRRFRALEYFYKLKEPPAGVSAQSIRRWNKWARDGEKRYGSAYFGLLRIRGRRAGRPDMERRQRELLAAAATEYVQPTREDGKPTSGTGTVQAAYRRLVDRCDREGAVPAPSLRSFERAIKSGRKAEVAGRRCGSGVGYQLEGPTPMGDGSTPPHGDRPFQYGLIDHLKCPVRLVSYRTGAVLGSPWLTLLVDAWSRVPLAMWLSFDDPARDRVLATLMDCARRHGRVPECLCCDQGSDFLSNDLEHALAVLGMHKLERPARKPRYGAVIERIFRSVDTGLMGEVPGSTAHLSFGRALSSERHPDRQATWTLGELHRFVERWLFEVYPGLFHTGIGQPPRERLDHGMVLAGQGVGRLVRYDRALEIALSVTPRKPTRNVDPGNGITVLYLRYWHDGFDAGDVSGSDVEVRINPSDASYVFARVKGQWVECFLAEGREELLGRSWRQIGHAVQEMRAQIRNGALGSRLDALTIGRFLREVDQASGTALARQIARDAEVPPALRFGAGSRGAPDRGDGESSPGAFDGLDESRVRFSGEGPPDAEFADDDFDIGDMEFSDEC